MTYTGSCMCGQLKYKVEAEPLQRALCHCLQCRKLTGTTYATTALFPRPSFAYTSSTPTLSKYTFTQESGIDFTIQFCKECSVSIGKTSEHEAFQEGFILCLGSLDGGSEVFNKVGQPQVELWGQHKASWCKGAEGAVTVDGMGGLA